MIAHNLYIIYNYYFFIIYLSTYNDFKTYYTIVYSLSFEKKINKNRGTLLLFISI